MNEKPLGLDTLKSPFPYFGGKSKVAADVWSRFNPLMRIALCGYEGEHEMPGDWKVLGWNAGAGYGGQNGKRERIYFSPACCEPQPMLL